MTTRGAQRNSDFFSGPSKVGMYQTNQKQSMQFELNSHAGDTPEFKRKSTDQSESIQFGAKQLLRQKKS